MNKKRLLAVLTLCAMLFSLGASAATYTVAKDDVLWKIAKNYGTTWQELAKLNRLKNPNLIMVGQTLTLPELAQGGTVAPITPVVPIAPEKPVAPSVGAKTATASATGFGGDVKVEVSLDGGKITAVTVVSHKETAGIGTPAIERLPALIVEKQSIALDTVAGATVSSKAILAATTQALTSLGGDMAKFSIPPVVAPTTPKETIKQSADVVIIGSGGAGMSAAVEVLKTGKSVIILEKMPTIGGSTKTAGSAYNTSNAATQKTQKMGVSEKAKIEEILTMPAKNPTMQAWLDTLQKEFDAYKAAGSTHVFDSPALHKMQTYFDGDYVANPLLIEVLADNSLDGLNFLSSLGAEWKPEVTSAVGATWTRSHVPTTKWGSAGSSFVLPQEKFVRDNKGTILCEYKVDEIIMQNGRAVGAKGKTADGTAFEISANKSVILATGGFSANVEMRQAYNKHWADLGPKIPTSNGPWATGDGIVMAEAIGANLVGMEWIQMVPGFTVFHPDIKNTLLVNKAGKRIVKEDGRRDEISSAILKEGPGGSFGLVDSRTVYDLMGGVSAMGQKVEDLLAKKSVVKGDTLEELAAQLGIDPVGLKTTVEDYNKMVDTRTPDPLGRSVFDQKIDKPPYFANPASALVHHTMGGVEINVNAEVLSTNGKIIPGLFAAGEVTGGLHGSNRLGGNAIADITVFGRIAGQNASK